MHLPAGYVVHGKHSYVLGAALGQGGFGITYIALDMNTNERVAIKEYYPTYCSARTVNSMVTAYSHQEEVYQKGKERFLDEARTLKSLSDLDSIVNVLEFFEANCTAYLVMEFLDGCSLKEYAKQHGKFPASKFLNQFTPLMEDIHRMHQRGVIHRDIAPDNIILLPNGQMKLIDFGAARSYIGDKSMTVVIKKGFAPVEQYMSSGSSACTDVYALAATIYYCITGTVPPDSAERQYSNAPLKPPSSLGSDITPNQEHTLLKALGIQPQDRTPNVQEFLNQLSKKSQKNATVPVQPDPPPVKPPEPPRTTDKWKLVIILAAVLGLLLATVLIVVLFSPGKSSDPSETTASTESSVKVNASVSDAFNDSFIEPEFGVYCCYHIPQITTNYFTCGDFNRDVYDELYGILQEQVYSPMEQGNMITLRSMNYNWGQKNNLVSFMAATLYLSRGWEDYYTYHVFADTGEPAGNSDILDAFQLTEFDFHDRVAERIRKCFEADEEDMLEYISRKEFDQLVADSVAPSNIQSAMPYIGSDGELYAIVGMYQPSDAGYCYRLLGITCQGEDTFPSCADHEKEYIPPETVPDPMAEKKQELGQAQIGDVIVYGTYEQDNDFSNGAEPIQWLVIGKTYNRLFVISQYALDHQSFHTERIPVTWEDCYLRQWLNDSFYNTAFSSEEQTLIPTVTVTADWNPKYDNNPGNDTEDKIYILSTSEAERFFSSNKSRICYATKYAKSHKKVWIDSDRGSIWWWLRTPGEYPSDATTVNTDGKIDYKDGMVDSVTGTVRPVFWIEFG